MPHTSNGQPQVDFNEMLIIVMFAVYADDALLSGCIYADDLTFLLITYADDLILSTLKLLLLFLD